MLVDMMQSSKGPVLLKSKQASDYLFVMTKFGELSIKQKVWSRIESLQIPSNELLTMQMQVFDSFYLGFLYLNPARNKQKTFLETLPESLTIHR